MGKKIKKQIREVIENTPVGYYIDSIDTQKIGEEWIVHANYKQKYHTQIIEAQWPYGHELASSVQLSRYIKGMEKGNNRVEVTHFTNENFVNAQGEDNEVSSAVVKIYDELYEGDKYKGYVDDESGRGWKTMIAGDE